MELASYQCSENINKKIKELVHVAMQASESVPQDVRAPQPERAAMAKARAAEVASVRGRPLVYPYIGSGLGRGAYVELEDGSVKLDLINGIGIHIMGHSHPKIIEASVRGALSDVVMQGNLEPNWEYVEFSKKLLEIGKRKSRFKYVWLATCGTMANENALKACRQKKSPARMIIAMSAAFAGRSTMMAEVTDNPAFKEGLPDYHEVLRLPFYDSKDPQSSAKALAQFKEHVAKHDGQISCFTLELLQGEGGFNVAPGEFFLPLFEFCREKKIPIWVDEVQTFMRTGEFFAFEKLNLGEYVDVCTIAKTAQTGATFFTEEFNPKPGLISGTFSGGSAALQAGLSTMHILDGEGYMGPGGKIEQIHNKFVAMLNKLNQTTCKGLLREAGGLGLMVSVVPFDGSKDKVNALLQKLFANGLVAFNCGRGPYKLRFLLPAILQDRDIEVAARVIEKSMLELA